MIVRIVSRSSNALSSGDRGYNREKYFSVFYGDILTSCRVTDRVDDGDIIVPRCAAGGYELPFRPHRRTHPVSRSRVCGFSTVFFLSPPFFFFSTSREIVSVFWTRRASARDDGEERRRGRRAREGERTAVPGGNCQVVSRARQLRG